MGPATPITRNGVLRTRTTWSSGLSLPNRVVATVWPRMATISPRLSSSGSNIRPDATSHSRAAKKSLSMAWIAVDQLVPSKITCACERMNGADATTPSTSRMMARASSSVRLEDAPAPSRTPPTWTLPAVITTRLAPRLRIWSLTRARAPEPMATMAITAATPMMMPSMVSMLRIAFAAMAWSADRRASAKLMAARPPQARYRLQHRPPSPHQPQRAPAACPRRSGHRGSAPPALHAEPPPDRASPAPLSCHRG